MSVCVRGCVSVSALMNRHSVTEYRPWQSRTDEMIQKPKHCPGSHHFSRRPRANIMGGSRWWSEATEPQSFFPAAKISPSKKKERERYIKASEISCFFLRDKELWRKKRSSPWSLFFFRSHIPFLCVASTSPLHFHILLCVYFLFMRLQPS